MFKSRGRNRQTCNGPNLAMSNPANSVSVPGNSDDGVIGNAFRRLIACDGANDNLSYNFKR